MTKEEIETRLKQEFPTANVRAHDMTGGGDHWQVRIEAEEFRGRSLIEQHQMVYRALGQWMNKEIHALSLDTKAL